MQFITLNQILNILTTICQNHGQVNDFGFGEVTDIAASEQENYPLVWADILPSQIAEKTLSLNLLIKVMDIQKADQVNERDTLSDTLSISQDIYAALNSPIYQDYFLITDSVSLTPIREGLPDNVNGWDLNIVFELAQLKDRCQIPSK
jgi:hypothetical protein